jgi:hypothetical protein
MDSWDFTTELFARIVVVSLIAFAIYYFVFHRRADFTIHVRRGAVDYRGRVPAAHRAAIANFLLEDLGLQEPVKIQGCWNKKRLNIWFRGRLGKGEKQRIRNFFAGRL